MKPTFHPASLNSSPLPNPSHRQFDVNDPEPVNRVSTPDKLASLRQKASLLLDVEHNFHGRIETRDGDQFELNSEFSFSVEFKQEMRLLEHQNRHSLQQKALDSFGVDRFDGPAQSNQSGKQANARTTATGQEVQDLDEIVPEFATSEATSERIVQFSTSLLPFFMAAEDGRTFDEETLDDFMALIRDSIDTGFNQARGIIGDMSLMNDPLSNLIQKTYDKVQAKLDTFFDDTLADIEGTKGDESKSGENTLDETETVTRFESTYQFNGELEETSSSTFNRRQ